MPRLENFSRKGTHSLLLCFANFNLRITSQKNENKSKTKEGEMIKKWKKEKRDWLRAMDKLAKVHTDLEYWRLKRTTKERVEMIKAWPKS